MIELKRILFPTDFSAASEGAREYAFELAERFDAELHLLHVFHDWVERMPEFGMGLSAPAYGGPSS